MADNKGKKWEEKFREDFLRSIPNSTIDRLYDTTNGYYGIKNICDFIGYSYPNIYYLECKEHKGASFPFANLTQYEDLVEKVGIKGVRVGVVLWLSEKDLVMYVPISTITKIMESGVKSVGIKQIKDGYNIKIIPAIKKRVYMECDFSCLLELEEGE